METQDIFRYS